MESSGESRFSTNCVVEANEIERLRAAYFVDTNENKIDLIVGVYRDDNGKLWPLPVVRKVEEELVKDMTQDYEYLCALGDKSFTSAASRLLLGGESLAIAEERVASIQSVSGTGALWIGAKYLSRVLNYNTFYMSSPTWNNHRSIFECSGLTDAREYRYWDPATRSIDMEGLLEDLRNAPKKSVIILQACSHNPTGLDPTRHQWSQIVDVLEEKCLLPFLDCAYQGFASGDIHQDAWTVRYLEKRGLEFMCAQSFAKIWVYIYLNHMENIIRSAYCNPPKHGCQIVLRILQSSELFQEWIENVSTMAKRVKRIRYELQERLECLETPGNWNHITQQIGMYSYTGMTPKQVDHMVKKYHIYMLESGRINMCGIGSKNIDYVARAIHESVVLSLQEPNETKKQMKFTEIY